MKEKLLFCLIFLLTGTAVVAQENVADTTNCDAGWLWTISGNDLQWKSYLFGTCHGDGYQFTENEMFSIEGLDDALSKVEEVLFEGGLDTTAIALASKEEIENFRKWITNPGLEWMMPEGTYYKPLYDTIAHFNEVNMYLYYTMKDPEYWKKNPGYWFSRLIFHDGLRQRKDEVSIDGLLKQEVEKRGLRVGFVEKNNAVSKSIFAQFTVMTGIDTIPMKRQANMLYQYIHNVLNNDSLVSMRRGFSRAYLENDTCKFCDFIRSIGQVPGAESDKDANHEVLHDRNVQWSPVIEQNITQHPCMIAVGCRHLLGSESLIALLRRKGYSVEPVRNM